jgi:hypothetical protein
MWGKGKGKLDVARDGATARGVVTTAQHHGGVPGSYGYSPTYYDLALDVHFDDGTTSPFACRLGSMMKGTDLRFAAGDVVPVRFDPADRSRMELDETAMLEGQAAHRETFEAARVHGAEMAVAAEIADQQRTGAPSDAELQDISDRWDLARARARECMEAHNAAKAAGQTKDAGRLLAEGALANSEQVALGDQYKRLRQLRPDWEPSGS